jgi:short-subunit dehydrogenase
MVDVTRYGPWALILGGSEGVGVSFARQLAKAGIHCVLVARQAALLERVAEQVRTDFGVQVRTLPLDLTRTDMLDRIRELTDDVEVGLVVYNAAAVPGGGGRFLECSLDVALHVLRLIPIGEVNVSHHFGTKMAARGRGGIILMGSLAGNAGSVALVPYSASKAFTQMFAEGLWAELRPLGVDVLCYVIGATATPSRARLHLIDQPGDIVADPDDIARLALENLGKGPVQVPPHLEDAFHRFSSMDRRDAVETMNAQLTGMNVGQEKAT